MDYSARLRRIEKAVDMQPTKERLVFFYDEESANAYDQQPNDIVIMYDYGEAVE